MNNSKAIYLDYASTSPVLQEVYDEMQPYFHEKFGNASSKHSYGKGAKSAIDSSCNKISRVLNCKPENIVFTSGATESINLAIKGIYLSRGSERNHIITSKTEHKAVLGTCEWLESIGANVTYLDVDEDGIIDYDQLEKALLEDPLLVSIMHVNNETGVIQDINRIGILAHDKGALFLSDTTQSFGKLELDITKSNIDMLCFSAHKIHGPKGVGGLYIKSGVELTPLIHGGGQQNGLRSGTFNVAGIVGLGKAAEIANRDRIQNFELVTKIMSKFIDEIAIDPRVLINGNKAKRSPYILNFGINDLQVDVFIEKHKSEFALATGSACFSELIESSFVLKAMNSPLLDSSIRISIDKLSNLDKLIEILKESL